MNCAETRGLSAAAALLCVRARQFDWDDHVFRSPAPRLADCRRLYLRDYEVHINIGAFEHEKRGEQRVVINIDLFVRSRCPPRRRPAA